MCVLRLLVTANVVASPPILVTLMMEAIRSPKRPLLGEPYGVTSQKTAFLRMTQVGIVTNYRLDGRGSILRRRKREIHLPSGNTGYGNHPASKPIGVEVKRPGRETDHSPTSSADIRNSRAIPPLLHTLWSRGV
jgi:hypothetical protein